MAGNKVVLLACGSFNPPTHMHLRMFEIARDYLNRMGTEVLFGIISPVHDAYGKKDLASASHRLAMTRIALQETDWIKLSDWECNQTGHSRTLLVLKHHQSQINTIINNKLNDNVNEQDISWFPNIMDNVLMNLQNVQVKLLCGADLLESFGTPGLWLEEDIEAIVKNHGLVVISRENADPNKFIYLSDILTKYMRNINIVTEWIRNEVSSSKIRRALNRQESVKYLVTDRVIDYIVKNELYGYKRNKYLLPPVTIYSTLLTPSPVDMSMDSPSPTHLNCINICNNNIFNTRASSDTFDKTQLMNNIKHPGQAVKIVAIPNGTIIKANDDEVYLDRPACFL